MPTYYVLTADKTRDLLRLERTIHLLCHYREGGREGGRGGEGGRERESREGREGERGGMTIIHIILMAPFTVYTDQQ